MKDLVKAAILNTPVANQLWVCGAQVDFLIGQFKEGSGLVGVQAIGAELIESLVLLLMARGNIHTRLQKEKSQNRSHS